MIFVDVGMNKAGKNNFLRSIYVKESQRRTAGHEDIIWEDGHVKMMDGPYGGVAWDDEYSLDELILQNSVYCYNEHSEE